MRPYLVIDGAATKKTSSEFEGIIWSVKIEQLTKHMLNKNQGLIRVYEPKIQLITKQRILYPKDKAAEVTNSDADNGRSFFIFDQCLLVDLEHLEWAITAK